MRVFLSGIQVRSGERGRPAPQVLSARWCRASRSLLSVAMVVVGSITAPAIAHAAPPASRPGWSAITTSWNSHCGVTEVGFVNCWASGDQGAGPPVPASGWQSVWAGPGVNCAIDSQGSLSCWGSNQEGQLNVPSGHKWISASPTEWSVCGVTDAGAGLCWGYNQGQNNVPPLATGERWASITGTVSSTCGVTVSGAGYCWGRIAEVASVPQGRSWKSIVPGKDTACGVTTGGEGICWGPTGAAVVTDIPPNRQWDAIRVAYMDGHACGVTVEGVGLCWGSNGSGESNVPALGPWKSISVGSGHSCGVTRAGLGTCWGWEANGYQIAGEANRGRYNSPPDISRPFRPVFTKRPPAVTNQTQPAALFTVAEPGGTVECRVDAGPAWVACDPPATGTDGSFTPASPLADGNHSISVRQTDQWGNESDEVSTGPFRVSGGAPDLANAGYNLFSGLPSGWTNSPHVFLDLPDMSLGLHCRLDTGQFSACSGSLRLLDLGVGDHSLSVHSVDGDGATGPDTTIAWKVVPPSTGWSSVSAGTGRPVSCGVALDGRAFCWGAPGTDWSSDQMDPGVRWRSVFDNGARCAINDTEDLICSDTNTQPPTGKKWLSVDFDPGSYNAYCGITTDHRALCWGALGWANIADGDPTKDWASVSVAELNVCGVTTSGEAACWGYGAQTVGQPPQLASGLTWTSLAVGRAHACGIDSSKAVHCWGRGDGGTLDAPAGKQFDSISADGQTTCGVTVAGEGLCWGVNSRAMGNVPALAARGRWKSISVGKDHACGLTAAGEAICWGGAIAPDKVPDIVAPGAPPGFSGMPASPTRNRFATIGFTLAEVGGTAQCSADGGVTSFNCTPASGGTAGTADLSGLPDGSKSLWVRQVDDAGNVGAWGRSPAWVVDTVGPAAPGAFSGVRAEPTMSRSATVRFSLAEAGGSAWCAIVSVSSGAGNPNWQSCTRLTALDGQVAGTALTDGRWQAWVRQDDAAGNLGEIGKSVVWTVDNVGPSAPLAFTVPTSPTRLTAADVGVTLAEPLGGGTLSCRVDAGEWKTCVKRPVGSSETQWIVEFGHPPADSPLGDAFHRVSVRQTDFAGNPGVIGTSPDWRVDTVAPAKPTQFTLPPSPTNQTAVTVGFRLAEAGGTALCAVDGQPTSGPWADCTPGTGNTGSFRAVVSGDGPHSLWVRQTDAAGNVSEIGKSGSWVLDTTGPAAPTKFTGVPSPATRSRTASIGFRVAESGRVECALVKVSSGVPPQESAVGWSNSCRLSGGSYRFSAQRLADGRYQLWARQTDLAGNVGAVGKSPEWAVDNVPPATPAITGVPSSPAPSTKATLAFTSAGASSFQCSVNGRPFSTCTSPLALTGLKEGQQTIAIKARDDAGNVSGAGKAQWAVAPRSWASVSSGLYHACGVTTAGEGLCWRGAASTGRGDQVPAGYRWSAIDSGTQFSCGVTTAGLGLCWGLNDHGQATVPRAPNHSEYRWTSISAGATHACGVLANGAGFCWGDALDGKTSVPAGRTWASISAGDNVSCGVTTAGKGLCWGRVSDQDPLSSGTWKTVTAGFSGACAVTTAGAARCWNTLSGTVTVPSLPPGRSAWKSLESSIWLNATCGVSSTGAVGVCALPAGSGANPSFTGVPSGSWASISPGQGFACGIRTAGDLVCWGPANQLSPLSVPPRLD